MAFKVYISPETAIKFRPAAVGGGGVDFNVENLAAGSGRVSARYDLGAGPRASSYEWRAKVTIDAPTVIRSQVGLWLVTSDGTLADGNLSSSEGALASVDKLCNLTCLGALTVDQTGSDVVLIGSGPIDIMARYVQLIVVNNTDDNFKNSSSAHEFFLTPVPDEIQA